MPLVQHPNRRDVLLVVAALVIPVALLFPVTDARSSRCGGSIANILPQGDCGSPYFYTIYAVDTLCCPNGTCAEFLCENVFCRTVLFGSYRCWQNLALCGVLYCPDQTIPLWREADWAIPCEVGPIITVPKEL